MNAERFPSRLADLPRPAHVEEQAETALSKNAGFAWACTSQGSVTAWVKGYAFEGDRLRRDEELGTLFIEVLTDTPAEDRPDTLSHLLHELNGMFAVVVTGDRWAFAAVDRVRSLPLFYGRKGTAISIGDSAEWVLSRMSGRRPDPVAREEFLLTGYVTGPDTLYADVKQIQAGCFIHVDLTADLRDIPQHHYYRYIHSYDDGASTQTLLERFEACLVASFERLIKLADGQTIVIPLSGYDSCLIALMLKRLGYDNVVAFTYGCSGSLESKRSRAIAAALGIRWEFIPYSGELWHAWCHSKEWAQYHSLAHELCVLPHLQDWPAVWWLRNRRRVSQDSIFAPGHFGDLSAGSKRRIIPGLYHDAAVLDQERIVNAVLRIHYSLFSWTRQHHELRACFAERILQTIGDLRKHPDNTSALKSWEVAERQAKLLVNSVRTYEFWGYRWALPLWDAALPEFWARVPLRFRRGEWLYDRFVRQKQEEFLGFSFPSQRGSPQGFTRSITHLTRGSRLEAMLRGAYRALRMRHAYDHHPFAWYGIVSRDELLHMYPRPRNINGVLAYLHLKNQGDAPLAGAGRAC